ncbi:hypothetical protein STEG23_028871 [Scotinomys teguina]
MSTLRGSNSIDQTGAPAVPVSTENFSIAEPLGTPSTPKPRVAANYLSLLGPASSHGAEISDEKNLAGFLEEGLLLNLEVIDPTRRTATEPLASTCLCFQSTGITGVLSECMSVSHLCLVLEVTEEGLELQSQMAVSHRVDAPNQIQVLWKSSKDS